MGESFDRILSGGSDDRKILQKQATANRQRAAQAQAQSKFVDDYMKIFGAPYGNTNFQESLSGYFNNQPLDQIAQNLASKNTFKVRVKPVYRVIKGDPGPSMMDYLGIGPGSGASVANLAANDGQINLF